MKYIFCLIAICLLSSCAMSPPEWKMAEDAVVINLEASNRLNYSNDKAHALRFVIYQLDNPNAFNQLTEDEAGLKSLLKSQVFNGSVQAVQYIIVYPGSDVSYRIDRADGARYVAVVAGYQSLIKERVVRLYEIPVYKKLFRRKLIPKDISIDLKLGTQHIENEKKKKD